MFLYGMSLIYGVTGSTYYDGIAAGLADRGSDTNPAVIVGMMLILAGVGFKVSAAPFHMWAPDAYQGAPMPIAAFLSTASKAAGFALILRLFTGALIVDAAEWRWAVAALAAITMTLGNLVAIQQTNLKRLVAYSSIGQVGYMLITIAAIGYGDAKVGQDASAALLLHIVGYVIATLALFAFAGLPPFAGFATKLFMFQGATTDELLWVVGLAVLNSFISLYYYLMVIRQMYLFDPVGDVSRWSVSPVLWCLAAVLMVGVVFIGVYPGPAFELTEHAAQPLFEAAGLGSFQVQQP
jgi:NADH-quinone oxidoreductase subunit N